MSAVYLDYNASSPVPEVITKDIEKWIRENFANPSSLHRDGRKARRLINIATEQFAAYADVEPEFVYWTSGASEANSWAIHSALEYSRHLNPNKNPRILISAIEHESVQMAAAWHKSKGVEVEFLPVNAGGFVEIETIRKKLEADSNWDLISVMHANNESGVIQPIEDLVKLAQTHKIPTHIDCVQTLGKVPLSIKKIGATYTTFSAHKLGGLKGTGVLAVQGTGRLLTSLIHGKQQKSLRAGTENPVGCAVFGQILSKMIKGEISSPDLKPMRDEFENELKKRIDGTIIHGEKSPRLPNTTFVGFTGTDGDGVLMNLDLEGVSASSGSACTSGSIDPSFVLLAMGCDKQMSRASVRFSSGRLTTSLDYETVLKVLPGIVSRCRS